MPENFIALGNDGGSNLLVYKTEKLTGGEAPVYWLDHKNDDVNLAVDNFWVLGSENV